MVDQEQLNKGIETQDEQSEVTAKQLLVEMERDVAAYEKSIEQTTKDIANYEEQLEVDKQLWDILEKPGSTRKLSPDYEYQTDEKWWDLMHKKQMFQLRQDRAIADGKIKQMRTVLEETNKAYDGAKERLTKFKSENIELLARMKRNGEN